MEQQALKNDVEGQEQQQQGIEGSVGKQSKDEGGRCKLRRWLIGGGLALLVAVAVAVGVFYGAYAGSKAPKYGDFLDVSALEHEGLESHKVFISTDDLINMMEDGNVAILDARPQPSYVQLQGDSALGKMVPGAVRAPWQEFTTTGKRGPLMSVEDLQTVFRSKGVNNEQPVVVYGGWSASSAWGEEGRIYWQLDYLNHTQVYVLYGGIYAWLRVEQEVPEVVNSGAGDFVARPVESRRISADEINEELEENPGNVIILDARTSGEFDGATPYGSERGGHIPTAESLDWRSLFSEEEGEEGNLKSAKELLAQFDALGVSNDTVIVTYCTGGVRSGFLYTVMRWLGYQVRNYAESWWDWSERDYLPVDN